jgi:uncharacterized lipoprotein YddW (UPF0748 family)
LSITALRKRVPRLLVAVLKLIGRYSCALLFLHIFAVNFSFGGIPQKKEFRGVWIATINNVDWPSSPGLPVEVQKRELKELIDRIEQHNLNVVIFQVRPASDAFYPSDTEPWSIFLTGNQGVAPSPFFDPLSFAIEVCHSKGMELHAWFNPFRVRNLGYYKLSPESFAARNPQFIHEYDKKLFLDPGFPQVRNHIVKVIMEVVRKYNIDAIHFDDYFYPYPVSGKKYPDLKTFRQYGKGYYPGRLGDWRRENINQFISSLHDSIKSVKPSLQLGISPFGIWRNERDDPNGSPGVRGTTSYDDLYADVYLWLANNWIDYVIPQLYWEQGNRFGDFGQLTQWWNDHSFGKSLYVGQALYKATGENKVFNNPKEISEQIRILRKFGNVGGFALYSASHLAKLSEIALNDLNSSLTPVVAETADHSPPVVPEKEVQPALSQDLSRERILMADKKSLADTISIFYKTITDQSLPAPEQYRLVKYSKGWELFWKINPEQSNRNLKFSVMAFEPNKGGGYRKKIIHTTSDKRLFITKDSIQHRSGVFFAIVSVSEEGYRSSFPKLFRIRGKRILFN